MREIVNRFFSMDQVDQLLTMADEQSDSEFDLQLDFDEATKFVRGLVGTAKSEDLLYFYSRYKQAKEGPCTTPKPSFYQLNEKAKWSAWSELGTLDEQVAMQQYVDRLSELEPAWRVTEAKELTEGWVSVSSHLKQEEVVGDQETLWDHVKQGRLARLDQLPSPLVGLRDEEGLTLLHWAADRGQVEVARHLLELDMGDKLGGGLINAQDRDGQTPLHYAASCAHKDLVRLLLKKGADKNIVDSDGLAACNSDTEPEIRELFD